LTTAQRLTADGFSANDLDGIVWVAATESAAASGQLGYAHTVPFHNIEDQVDFLAEKGVTEEYIRRQLALKAKATE
jgi:hypothetical protein